MLYFISGLGGAGTLPLAFILKGLGHEIAWSDRGRDQQQNPAKFAALEAIWPRVYPQDGSGIKALAGEIAAVIPSGLVESDVPDLATARSLNVPLRKRPEMLAGLFNEPDTIGIAIAGTSGKTTTTGMTGYLLREMGKDPTVMNGGVFRNYKHENPWCCAMTGKSNLFVTEVDESDGSIDLYKPRLAVLTNISLDHKSMEELRALFTGYLQRSPLAVVNFDDAEVKALLQDRPQNTYLSYGLDNADATLVATDIKLLPDGSTCTVTNRQTGVTAQLRLRVLGRHNISNALAALGAVSLAGDCPLEQATVVLGGFEGIERRLEVIGTKGDITVIDDFAHNPDKISASLSALKAFPGRLLVMFQPHGFGPLRLMRHELVDSFAKYLGPDDQLFMPEPFYAGGTVDRSVTSAHLIEDLKAKGIKASVWPDRASITEPLLTAAKPGDRLIVMGARDDTLGDYARDFLKRLSITA